MRVLWRMLQFVGSLSLSLAFGASVSGQSLAEAARKEKERRQKAGPAGPVFTEDDLKRASGNGTARSAKTGPSSNRSASGEKAGAETTRKEDMSPGAGGMGEEAYWRGRAKSAHDAVAAAEARVVEAEATVRRTPAGIRQPQPSDALAQIPPFSVTDADRQAAEADVAAARRDLKRAKEALEDLEDEARRQGALPGWLR